MRQQDERFYLETERRGEKGSEGLESETRRRDSQRDSERKKIRENIIRGLQIDRSEDNH